MDLCMQHLAGKIDVQKMLDVHCAAFGCVGFGQVLEV